MIRTTLQIKPGEVRSVVVTRGGRRDVDLGAPGRPEEVVVELGLE